MTTTGLSNNVRREYKTVRLWRTPAGFGFSLTGQYPCVLTHVVEGSPAFKAGLKVGDYLIMVNGYNVVNYNHDTVVSMVAACPDYVMLQVAQRTAAAPAPAVQCTCSLNCQSMSVPHYNVPSSNAVPVYPQPQALPPQGVFPFDYCGVLHVGFLKLHLPANATAAVFTRLLSNSLNHFLMNKNLISMQPFILSANRQANAICLTDNKNGGFNFTLNSVAFVGTIPESPTNMFGLILHCPPNPICVCHIFSTSLTHDQHIRLKSPSYHSAPDVVRYLNSLIVSTLKTQPLCDSSNYNPNIPAACSTHRRMRTQQQQPPNFEAEIFIDNFQFPAGSVYTVSERNAMVGSVSSQSEDPLPPRPRGFPGGKPPKCGCQIGRLTSNPSSASSANNCHDPHMSSNSNNSAGGGEGGTTFDARQAALALARSRSLSRYNRKGVRGGSSRSSGSDDGRFGRGGGSSGGSGSFRLRYGSQRHKHHRSDKHRRRQDSSGASGSARFGISDETTTTTSTTTFDSSTAAANSFRRHHYGQFWQSGSRGSLYRSRSIDSLVNASKEESQPATNGTSLQKQQQHFGGKQNGGHFFSMEQQQHVVIGGPCIQVDRVERAYFNNKPTVSTDASGLALNSLLSPRYASFGPNASETDLDYEESQQIADSSNSSEPKNANNSQTGRSVASGSQQQQVQPHQAVSNHHHHHHQISTNQKPDNKRVTPNVMVVDAFEARSSTASVETRTEVAGSTLSLPISSASATIPKGILGHPITFDSLLQDKSALELFRKFLKSQVADENLEFLLACDNFRASPSGGELLANNARLIFEQFISPHSKQPVNLTWQIVANIRRTLVANNVRGVSPTSPRSNTSSSSSANMMATQKLDDVPRDIYDTARDHVYRLLKKDCYPRFIQSELYKELIGENKSVACSVDSGASFPSAGDSAFKPSGLRLSSRKNRSGKNVPSSNSSSNGSSSMTSNTNTANSINWNPAKLLSHIIGRAKNKPGRQKSGGDVTAPPTSFRVTFPDGTVETVSTDEIKSGFVTSLADCLGPMCAARGMSVFLCAIYQHGSEQPIDSQLSAASFSGRDLIVEQQAAFVVFYFSGPSTACRRLLIRAKPCRRIADVLQWDERKGDDAVVIKEVWCLETPHLSPKSPSHSCLPPVFTFTKVNTSSNFEGLVRDVQNHFTIAIAATRSESYDSASICNLVQSHFESQKLPSFEDVLNAVTSSHSWHTFDEYGRINLAKAISPPWRALRQSLAIGEPPGSLTCSKDESSDYLEGDDFAEALACSLEDHQQKQERQDVMGPPQEVVVNEPRSRRPILSTSTAIDSSAAPMSSSKPASSVQCRLIRGVHPLGEIPSEQYYGRATPSSIDVSFSSERVVGVNNINYEMIDAQGNIRQSTGRVSRFVRIGSSGDLLYESPGRENNAHLQNSLLGGCDENSCLLSGDEAGFLGHTFQASPYARRLPRPIQMPKMSISINNEDEQCQSSTPSPSTHQIVLDPPNQQFVERSPASLSATSTVRITESTL